MYGIVAVVIACSRVPCSRIGAQLMSFWLICSLVLPLRRRRPVCAAAAAAAAAAA